MPLFFWILGLLQCKGHLMDKINVLVVDDKKIIRDLFDYILGYHGHHITAVSNGTDAIEAVIQNQFDVVFLDIVMPGTDGVTVLERFKEIKPQMPVVMMSGYSVKAKQERVAELGAVTCLRKPFEMDEVAEVLKVALGKEIQE